MRLGKQPWSGDLPSGLDTVVNMSLARCLSLTDGSFACCRHQSCEVMRSSKHEEAAKKQRAAGRGEKKSEPCRT